MSYITVALKLTHFPLVRLKGHIRLIGMELKDDNKLHDAKSVFDTSPSLG